MASESSSAVIDLNDAGDGEKEANEGAPVIMDEGYDIGVKVDSPMKQLSTLETYITYRVRCVCARWTTPEGGVRRRYNHFKVFHKRLTALHPFTPVPPLPALHSARQQLDRYAPSFVAIRAVALNSFLSRVAKHPILSYSEDLKLFVTTPDDDFDKVFKVESRGFNLWGLSNALYGGHEPKPVNNGPRVKDPEFLSMSDYLQSLEKKLTTLYTITNKLFKAHAGLTHELDKLSETCVRWRRTPPPLVPPVVWTLPLSALHTRVLLEHLHNRDQTHATYVAGNESSNELKDRLEQQTESLRAELQDWLPKTRADTKAALLEIANKQIETHKIYLMSWERALKLSTEPNMSELFKTVSKNAVQNLSPSKSNTDFDKTDTVSDFDSKCDEFNDFGDGDEKHDDDEDSNDDNTRSENIVVDVYNRQVVDLVSDSQVEVECVNVDSQNLKVDNHKLEVDSQNLEVDNHKLEVDSQNLKVDNLNSQLDNQYTESDNEVLHIVKSDSNAEIKRNLDVKVVTSDPLQDFADVDLTD